MNGCCWCEFLRSKFEVSWTQNTSLKIVKLWFQICWQISQKLEITNEIQCLFANVSWYRSKKMGLAKQHSTGRNGRNVILSCHLQLVGGWTNPFEKHDIVKLDHFPPGFYGDFAFMFLPPTFSAPKWLASNMDCLRCTVAGSWLRSSGNVEAPLPGGWFLSILLHDNLF